MNKKYLSIIFGIIVLIGLISVISADPGSIWTTRDDCGDSSQDVNQYARGEIVYLNGNNFNPGTYSWDITGQPSSCDPSTIVASGTVNVNSTGKFCFPAYQISLDDCKGYKVDVGGKTDNYSVDENLPVVPEFGIIISGITIIGAIGMFLFVRRR
jgi:hypothetical protein